MSETGNGDGNGEAKVTVPLEALVDELVIRFNRLDGTLAVGGHACNDEVILMMLYRAVNLYEFRTRAGHAMAAAQEAREAQRVSNLIAGHRPASRG